MTTTRRTLLRLAAAQTVLVAAAGALRAEGGQLPAPSLPGSAPVHCDAAALRVRDLEAMTRFYRDVLGLQTISATSDEVVLGAGGSGFLHLIASPGALPAAASEAGLFHIAYLMPSRQDLARWLVHVAMLRQPLTGFADHLVSEAVYLDDPEGNGIEVYRDRPPADWRWRGGQVEMATDPLDVDGLLAMVPNDRDTYTLAPDGLRIGHMHLKVGDIAAARGFYQGTAGLELTRSRDDSAAFLASGGYHHHLGLNIWNSAGAGPRDPQAAGLAWFSLRMRDGAALAERQAMDGAAMAGGGIEITDPWGTRLRLLPG